MNLLKGSLHNLGEKLTNLPKNSNKTIKKPNSYQKSLYLLFQQGEISKTDYYRELKRYNDFLIQNTISDIDVVFDNLISDIEFKELLPYLQNEGDNR